MPVIQQASNRLPATPGRPQVVQRAPAPQAAPQQQAAPAPQQQAAPAPRGQQRARSFGEAKSRGQNGIFLKAIDRNTAATYTVRVNRVIQKWADPFRVNPMFAQPTPDEAAAAEPAFKRKDSYVIECEVFESNNPLCPVGYTPSIIFNDTYPDSYMGDIKGFLAALFNANEEDVTLDDWAGSYKPEQPCAGMMVKVTVREQKNRGNEGTYTRHIFNPSPLQYPQQG